LGKIAWKDDAGTSLPPSKRVVGSDSKKALKEQMGQTVPGVFDGVEAPKKVHMYGKAIFVAGTLGGEKKFKGEKNASYLEKKKTLRIWGVPRKNQKKVLCVMNGNRGGGLLGSQGNPSWQCQSAPLGEKIGEIFGPNLMLKRIGTPWFRREQLGKKDPDSKKWNAPGKGVGLPKQWRRAKKKIV